MPKIIENVREQLLAEAKRQISENGYSKTTIRSVAAACGLGVGTVYNYFPSKDTLIASFMAKEWQGLLGEINRKADAESLLFSIFSAITVFSKRYDSLFADRDAEKVFASAFSRWHPYLRSQIADIILPLCEKSKTENKKFLAEYISEGLLSWTVSGKDFGDQFLIIKKLLV